MKPIYKKYLAILVVMWGCSSIVLLVAHICLIMPQQGAIKDIQKQLTERTRVYDDFKLANTTQARDKRSRQIEQLNKNLESFVAKVDELDNLKISISKIADEIDVEAFASKGRTDESYRVIPNYNYIGQTYGTIGFCSSFNKFARLINALERHQPIIFVEEFAVSRSLDNDSRHTSSILLSILVRRPLEDVLADDFQGIE